VALLQLEQAMSEQVERGSGLYARLDNVAGLLRKSRAELVEGKPHLRERTAVRADGEVVAWLQSGFLSAASVLAGDHTQRGRPLDEHQQQQQQQQRQQHSHSVSSTSRLAEESEETRRELVRLASVGSPAAAELDKVRSWDEFDVFALDAASGGRCLSVLLVHLCSSTGLCETFNMSEAVLCTAAAAIEAGYDDRVPYHNHLHAADVLANTFYFCQSRVLSALMSRLDLLAALIAASVHDLGHPGTNNAFSVTTEDEVALIYNDRSVLENMHIARAFRLFREKGANVFGSLSKEQRREARQMVIAMVLATDMSLHLKYSADLEAALKAKRDTATWFKPDLFEDRALCLAMALHVADLGNPAKPTRICVQWTSRVVEEFFRQGDREKQLGLAISPMMNRDKPAIEKSQIGFIDYVIHPLYKLWNQFIPEETQPCLENIKTNRIYWEGQLKAAESQSNDPNKGVVHATVVKADEEQKS
jgi:cAMP-specific phosphodiesterase 4